MSTFRPEKTDQVPVVMKDGKTLQGLKNETFKKFNPGILGLGDITQKSTPISSICAIFDLQGFTDFCKQIDPELSVPKFLSTFLDWMFERIREETTRESSTNGVVMWHPLPFFSKFMGDGLLFLWPASEMSEIAQHNLIVSLEQIREKYITEFLPKMNRKAVDIPTVLRCGIAKGTVFSVGNGEDFIGSCINLASRIQKLPGCTIAFNARGFDPESRWKPASLAMWKLKKVTIRGIGNNELVYIRSSEFSKLSKQDAEFFREP